MTELLDRLDSEHLLRRELFSTAGEEQLNILAACAQQGRSVLFRNLLSELKKCVVWEMAPGIFERRVNELILAASGIEAELHRCCMVEIDGFPKSYAYLTDDLTIEKGERVLVPFGEANSTQLACVVRSLDCTADTAPYPIDRLKKIICRAQQQAESDKR